MATTNTKQVQVLRRRRPQSAPPQAQPSLIAGESTAAHAVRQRRASAQWDKLMNDRQNRIDRAREAEENGKRRELAEKQRREDEQQRAAAPQTPSPPPLPKRHKPWSGYHPPGYISPATGKPPARLPRPHLSPKVSLKCFKTCCVQLRPIEKVTPMFSVGSRGVLCPAEG